MSTGFEDVGRAAERLHAGGVVAFPTETVYGLGADALSEAAVARVFALKGRPRGNPLIVHVSGAQMARRAGVVGAWPERAERLARAFWPGPVSILVPRGEGLPGAVTAGGPLVAVRCPNHPVALALLFEFGGPLVGPSANRSGEVSPTAAEHVREAFDEREVMVLDGGVCATGIESTVVDVTADPVRVLRPGVIGAAEIAGVLGVEVVIGGGVVVDGAMPSPGLLERHYAPGTPAVVFEPCDWEAVMREPGPAVVITHRLHVDAPVGFRVIEMAGDAAGYGAGLYAALREADRAGGRVIYIERPPIANGAGDDVWVAVADRLRRAAGIYR